MRYAVDFRCLQQDSLSTVPKDQEHNLLRLWWAELVETPRVLAHVPAKLLRINQLRPVKSRDTYQGGFFSVAPKFPWPWPTRVAMFVCGICSHACDN